MLQTFKKWQKRRLNILSWHTKTLLDLRKRQVPYFGLFEGSKMSKTRRKISIQDSTHYSSTLNSLTWRLIQRKSDFNDKNVETIWNVIVFIKNATNLQKMTKKKVEYPILTSQNAFGPKNKASYLFWTFWGVQNVKHKKRNIYPRFYPLL